MYLIIASTLALLLGLAYAFWKGRTTDLVVNWRIRRDSVISIYRNYRYGINETILLPLVSESLRAVTARHDSEELLTKRDVVSAELFAEPRIKLSPHHIDIVGLPLPTLVSLPNIGRRSRSGMGSCRLRPPPQFLFSL